MILLSACANGGSSATNEAIETLDEINICEGRERPSLTPDEVEGLDTETLRYILMLDRQGESDGCW